MDLGEILREIQIEPKNVPLALPAPAEPAVTPQPATP